VKESGKRKAESGKQNNHFNFNDHSTNFFNEEANLAVLPCRGSYRIPFAPDFFEKEGFLVYHQRFQEFQALFRIPPSRRCRSPAKEPAMEGFYFQDFQRKSKILATLLQ
jgi:hypothetical protein